MATPDINKTIKMLSFIKQPKIEAKILARPPIKFLRDIFESIIKTTGFMKGLFKKEDINDEALKSRDKKRDMFLKVVTLLETISKKQLGINPDKILAGQEVDKTNLMLQILGRVATKPGIAESSRKHVKVVLEKLKSEQPSSSERKARAKAEKQKQVVSKVPSNESSKESPRRSKINARPTSARKRPVMRRDPSDVSRDEVEVDDNNEDGQDQLNLSRNSRSHSRSMNNSMSEGTQNNLRPGTARGVSRNGNRPTTAKNVNDQFLVETAIMPSNDNAQNQMLNLDADGGHGVLVNNMLNARNINESGIDEDDAYNDDASNFKFTNQQMELLQKQRNEMIATKHSINKVLETIETLTKVTENSFEDNEQMNKEHQYWRKQVLLAENQLNAKIEASETESKNIDKNLDNEISELESQIEQKRAQIRSQIATNMGLEEKLQRMLDNLVA